MCVDVEVPASVRNEATGDCLDAIVHGMHRLSHSGGVVHKTAMEMRYLHPSLWCGGPPPAPGNPVAWNKPCKQLISKNSN